MFTVYILYSDNHGIHYVGYTSDLTKRFISHNSLATKGWTVKYRPWRIIHIEEFEVKSIAMAREKWLKSGIGREFIKTLPH
jgi:putative endonuclease